MALLSLTTIPPSFGAGGANIGDGSPKLQALLAEYKAGLETLDTVLAFLRGAPTALSGAGAIALTAPTCLYTSTGDAQALTVADATVAGHRVRIVHIVDGGSGVITQTTGAKLTAGVSTITLTNAFDWVELEWSGTLWNIVGYYGATIA